MMIRIFLINFFVLVSSFLYSQNVDYQIWNRVELNYQLAKKNTFSFQKGFRLGDDLSVITRSFYDFHIKSRHTKVFSHSIGYRHLLYRDFNDPEREQNHRFYFDIFFKKKLSKRIDVVSRSRWQKQMSLVKRENKIRQKIKLIMNPKKKDFNIVLSVESFSIIDKGLEKIRSGIGVSKKLSKKLGFNINYLIQRELNSDNPDMFYVFRTKISYNI